MEKNNKIIKIDKERFISSSKKLKNKFFLRLLISVILTGLLVYFISYLYSRYNKYDKYDILKEQDLSTGSFVGYSEFKGKFVKYSKDGLTFLDDNAKDIWIDAYEMKDPIVADSKEYIAVADRKSTKILIFSEKGRVGEINTVLPINKIVISDNGIIVALLEDINATYISFYYYDGRTLDISIKSKLSGDGYPTDISISPTGEQLIVAYQYISYGELKGRVVFYDFSEKGKNVANRIVGGFDKDFEDSLIARVKFIDSNNAFVASNKGIFFFSLKNLLSPELINSRIIDENLGEEIRSVFYKEKKLAVVYKTLGKDKEYTLVLYNYTGKKILSKSFNYDYKYLFMDKENIYIGANDGRLFIYNMFGNEKFASNIDMDISYIKKARFGSVYKILNSSKIREIKLK